MARQIPRDSTWLLCVRVAPSNRRSRLPHGSSPSAEIVFFAKVKTEIFPKEKASPIFHQENGDDRSL